MSFEKLKLTALKHSNDILSWINTFTKDSMLIVDEVHNLIASTYSDENDLMIFYLGKISGRAKGIR
jgi:Holliday junction resolvasome RuvABC ATP-dependent DNA helicase subunit